jgi:hypothetical protein
MNQVDIIENYKSQDFINTLYATNLGGTTTSTVFETSVTFVAKPTSTLYSGSVTKEFKLQISSTDFNYTGAPQEFTAPVDATYLMET